MTGGAGFSSAANNSLRENRGMLNRRTPQKDNPYNGPDASNRKRNENVREIIDWKNFKIKREQRFKNFIWSVLSLLFLILILAYFIF
ncbi:hypothetical protein LVD15_20315 [Fulvivirga maritima]|uniref:hypothetical protein n=1 Tax=Fulvivirga maritima TaxID=2904247 RepID=UPI001F4150CA|nr:hypothetical protein [Fulvivirga maritima]UII25628.1 hypothetical protein LVD15_20315 [Fulvivirga maritima]